MSGHSESAVTCRKLLSPLLGPAWALGRRFLRFEIVRVPLGILLLVTCALKAFQLLVQQSPTIVGHQAGWLGLVLIPAELLLGLWLLSGFHQKLSWSAALVTFSGFAGYSLIAVLQGHSCGCFGALQTGAAIPFAIDLGAIGLLLLCRLAPQHCSAHHIGNSVTTTVMASRWPSSFRASMAIVFFFFSVGMSTGLTLSGSANGLEGGKRTGDAFVFDPSQWIGKRFPLLEQIDIGKTLSRGLWTVLLYRHDCPKCQAVIPFYENLAERNALMGDMNRFALVDVSSGGSSQGRPHVELFSEVLQGKCHMGEHLFVATPLELQLVDGQLRSFCYDPSAEIVSR